MLTTFLVIPVSFSRLQSAGGNKRSFSTVFTANSQIQKVDDYQQPLNQGVAGKLYKCWLDVDKSPREGDLIQERSTGRQFKAIAVERQGQGLGLAVEHYEIIMERYNY